MRPRIISIGMECSDSQCANKESVHSTAYVRNMIEALRNRADTVMRASSVGSMLRFYAIESRSS
jgi:hypothetical protein